MSGRRTYQEIAEQKALEDSINAKLEIDAIKIISDKYHVVLLNNVFGEIFANVATDVIEATKQSYRIIYEEYMRWGAIYGKDHNGLMRWLGDISRIVEAESEKQGILKQWRGIKSDSQPPSDSGH